MSSTNVYRKTTAADYLNQLRLQQQSDLVGNTSQTNYTPLYIIQQTDTIDITDAVSNNANTQTQADVIDITDSVVQTSVNTGLFEVEDDSSYQKLWLSFDQDYVDKSGNNNAGTLTGTETYVAGPKTTKAFSFDGSTNINFGNATGLNFERTQPFSMSCWIKSTVGGSSGFGTIYGKINPASNNQGIIFITDTTGKLRIYIQNNQSTNALIIQGSTVVRNGFWNHVVITYDGSSSPSGVKFYVNGVLETNTTVQNNLSASILNSNNAYVAYDTFSTDTFVGSIADLQIWNYVLSQADINTLLGGQQIAHNPAVTPVAKVEFCDCAA